MADPAAVQPICVIHQIFPKPVHDLVAKLRQETARADVLGETGQPILVIGAAFDLLGRSGAFSARIALRFLVEGQGRALWTPADLFPAIRGTPAEAVMAQILRVVTEGAPPLCGWVPPDALGLSDAPRLALSLMGSLTILTRLGHADSFGPDMPAAPPAAACLPEGRSDIEMLELGLRAASDFRRFLALGQTTPQMATELDFSGLSPIRAA